MGESSYTEAWSPLLGFVKSQVLPPLWYISSCPSEGLWCCLLAEILSLSFLPQASFCRKNDLVLGNISNLTF